VNAYRYSHDDALSALGDPTRRRVFELLGSGPRTVGELAADMPVSRPAVSQHLKVLKGAGLVTATVDGTRHLYSVDPGGLEEIRRYVDGMWDVALESFRKVADGREK
jgi:DNA-binding transcriptional ArsR family regulator